MKLLHLYPDLMNLYGDNGNLRLLARELDRRGLSCEVVPVKPGDPVDWSSASFVYMGPGTEPARDAALEHLRPHASALEELVEEGVPMLFTGNSWLTLGSALVNPDGATLQGLGLFDFDAVETWDRRYTGDAIAAPAAHDLPAPLTVGFLNKCDLVEGVENPLFTLEMGEGNFSGSPAEGARRKNLFCTHLIGPLLVKNPHWLSEFAGLLGAVAPVDETSQAFQAYQVTLEALEKRKS